MNSAAPVSAQTTLNPARPRRRWWPWLLLIVAAILLRGLRLNWQPLWWDEGYSVYFATEPLARMVALTAGDIHPPLYYTLLHLWMRVAGSATPLVVRTFSVLTGVLGVVVMIWLARTLWPGRTRLVWSAALLLLLNPMHIYYSQEVRMYGLAMLLGMAASGFLWRRRMQATAGNALGYLLFGVAALYTLYYTALLFLAHALTDIWALRRSRRRLLQTAGLYTAMLLLYLPWLLYALPRLTGYVSDKVQADADRSLGPVAYLWRHVMAFAGGQLPAEGRVGMVLTAGAALLAGLVLTALIVLGRGALQARRSRPAGRSQAPKPAERSGLVPEAAGYADVAAAGATAIWLLVPVGCAFLLNLRLPFFPVGGERLLLVVLPYALLLVAWIVDGYWSRYHLGKVALFLLAGVAAAGIYLFYTTPRYADRDYRPIIGQVVQQGRPGDTFLALFPWQVGYWRAYVPPSRQEEIGGPEPLLPAEGALVWGQAIDHALDTALDRGTLWFPAPLSFGSTLPAEVESVLAGRAFNLENRWFSETTRLSAWASADEPTRTSAAVDFGVVTLNGAGAGPESVPSANVPLAVALGWHLQGEDGTLGNDLFVSLRLEDGAGRVWSARDYAPLGSMGGAQTGSDRVGLVIPVGLPPDRYRVRVGVGLSGTQELVYPPFATVNTDPLLTVAEIQVTTPVEAQSRARLPIRYALHPAEVRDGLAFLGYAGIDPDDLVPAGTELKLTLFLRNDALEAPARALYVSILDEDGAGVGGWEGWPLPGYPTEIWPEDALVRVPVSFFLPATLEAGRYQLIAGLLQPENGVKSAPVDLGGFDVVQRAVTLEPPTPATPLDPPVRVGTHADLAGYDLVVGDEAIDLILHWSIQQTLLPPHQIFVHLDGPDGVTLAQDDGPPRTAAGFAPTGSWLPGETISTLHRVDLPADLPAGAVITVGLYNPDGNIRLPVTRPGDAPRDAWTIPLE